MKKIFVYIATALLLAVCCFSAEYDGYVVRISENTASLLADSTSMFSGAMLASDLSDSETVELISDEIDSVTEINSDHMLVKVDSKEALDELISLGIVENYEENYYLELHGYDVTLNEAYDLQKWYLDCVNVDFAWDAAIYGDDVIVGVIDSGVYRHNDFGNNLIPGENFVPGLDATDTNDEYGHGTYVAGIIASRCNTVGTVGVSFRSKIVPLKVTNDKTLTVAYAVSAIYRAVDYYECDVINMSFGDSVKGTELEKAVNYAVNNNVIVVASAGNGGNSGYAYPAAFDCVVSVANADRNGSIYSSSQRNDMVDIAAPGTGIIAISNSGNLNSVTGTSFSAPIVSAAAALAKSVNPNITPNEFQSLIKQSADTSYIASSGQNSNAWGAGMLDIEAFFKLMMADEKCYVSKNLTIDDETFVYLTNISETNNIDECVVTLSEYNADGTLKKTQNVYISIPASTTYEFSLTEYGFSSSASVRATCDRIPGDVNDDGDITVKDASVILRYIANYPVSYPTSWLDTNGDGVVTVKDASAILRFIAKYQVELY